MLKKIFKQKKYVPTTLDTIQKSVEKNIQENGLLLPVTFALSEKGTTLITVDKLPEYEGEENNYLTKIATYLHEHDVYKMYIVPTVNKKSYKYAIFEITKTDINSIGKAFERTPEGINFTGDSQVANKKIENAIEEVQTYLVNIQ